MNVISENGLLLHDPKSFPISKVTTVKSTLQQTIANLNDLVANIEELDLENQNYRNLLVQKENQNRSCFNCEDLKKEITAKENIFEYVVSALHELNDTKDFKILDTIFKNLHTETTIQSPKSNKREENLEKADVIVFNKEIIEDNNESVLEIEGTPTERKSPIISSKKKNTTHCLSLKDKKKCPESWPTPEKKNIKLSFPTPTRSKPSGRLRQARLNLKKIKTTKIVDLTCSHEIMGRSYCENNLKQNVKLELFDADDTILPSPPQGPVFQPISKSILKESPIKFKKPLNMKLKIERDNEENELILDDIDLQKMEDSINILQYPQKFVTPTKQDGLIDETLCPDESLSLLQQVNKVNKNISNCSPPKRPLAENLNISNAQEDKSISILQRDDCNKDKDIIKRLKSDVEPQYKEAGARRTADKKALPGWCCDGCTPFLMSLYKDNPEMLAKKIAECSKHRGRSNPVRPKTPEGFWNPRWAVPHDTEEFNRRNNV